MCSGGRVRVRVYVGQEGQKRSAAARYEGEQHSDVILMQGSDFQKNMLAGVAGAP